MNAIAFSFIAAGCASLSSLAFRKNADQAPSNYRPTGYLTVFYLISFLLAFLLYPETWKLHLSTPMLAVGAAVGFLSSLLMVLTARALQQGPSGLTFAFQNASAIFPGLLLFLLLGPDFGYSTSLIQWAGMLLVLLGLFIGAKKTAAHQPNTSTLWLKYALACFLLQILALTLIQARCLLYHCGEKISALAFLQVTPADDIWFMPGLFGTSFLIQALLFYKERSPLHKRALFFGSLGGIANFSSTLLLMLATQVALPYENGILFPCFAVATMVLCNLWAKVLYKEDFNLMTNALCSLGIFMAVAN